MKELKISAIEEGTVIDHIPADITFKIVNLLELNKDKNIVSVATNLNSNKIGAKGLIKIANRFLTKEEVAKIAIIAPNATLNIIKEYLVKEKSKLEIPKEIVKILKCNNPNCITNHEEIVTKFEVVEKNPLIIRCHYCERDIEEREIIECLA